MTDSEITVADVIRLAGGANAVARAASEFGLQITRDAVYKWRATGIPDRYWAILADLSGATVETLYRANCRARGQFLVTEAAE